MKFIGTSYSSYTKDIHQIWCRSAKFLWKSKFCSGSGSRFYFGFQYQTYILHTLKTFTQIFFGSANSFESYCVHMKSPRTVQPDIQTDRRKFFLACFVFQDIQIMNIRQKERIFFFFFTRAITILSLFTYSVCDDRVKSNWLITKFILRFLL